MSDDLEPIDHHHPRHTFGIVGHEKTQQLLLERFNDKKLHHAWLISGPRGIGKATLAYHFARFLLSQPADDQGDSLFGDALPVEKPTSLEINPDHPVAQRISAGGHGNLRCLERGYDKGKMKNDIGVDVVRDLISFFSQTAAEGGWRVAIIDSIDHLNRNASNALLKLLEEPPKKSLLLLVSHSPGGLLPTIKSRCQALPLQPLSTDQAATVIGRHQDEGDGDDLQSLTDMAKGAPGIAIELAQNDGLELYKKLIQSLLQLPRIGTEDIHNLATSLTKKGQENQWRMFMELFRGLVGDMIRYSASQIPSDQLSEQENRLLSLFQSVSTLDQWIDVWEKMGEITKRAEAIHLDRAQVVIHCFMMVQDQFTDQKKSA